MQSASRTRKIIDADWTWAGTRAHGWWCREQNRGMVVIFGDYLNFCDRGPSQSRSDKNYLNGWMDINKAIHFSLHFIHLYYYQYYQDYSLTRALLGGGRLNAPPPLRFFEDSEKNGGAQRRRVFTHLTPHLFCNFCENFGPRLCEVRSPGQVKWPNYKITFPSRHGYNVSGKVMKLSEYDEVISAYKTSILDFWYRWPQVRSFLRPPHYKSMAKKSTLLYLLWRKRFWVESYLIGQLWTIRVKNCFTYPSKGHLRSPEVTNRHLPITFDQKEIETWDWCQYVRLGQANPMMCNMTHFGHHVTLAWLDLRSNFDLDL